jgi:hypothetical protein
MRPKKKSYGATPGGEHRLEKPAGPVSHQRILSFYKEVGEVRDELLAVESLLSLYIETVE